MWRRRKDILKRRMLSGILACLLVATTALNTVGIISSFAGERTEKPRISYKYHGKQDVQITVLAENESFAPGAEVALKIYVQNNTDKLLTEGSLKWSGKDLEEAGFPEIEAEEWVDLDDDMEDDSEDDDIEWGIGPGGTPSDAVLGTPSNPYIESDGVKIKHIELAPGEVYETEFYGYISEDLKSVKNRKITFAFAAKKEGGGSVSETKDFTYNTGMAGLLPVEFENGNNWMTNERNTIYLRTRFEDENLLDEFGEKYFTGDKATTSDGLKETETVTEEAITAAPKETEGPAMSVTETAEITGEETVTEEIGAEETATEKITSEEITAEETITEEITGTGTAEGTEAAVETEASAEEEVESGAAEEETTVGETEEEITGIETEEVPLAESPESFLDPEAPNVATVSDADDEGTDPKNIRYTIETYGAKLKGITAWYEEEESSWGETVTGVSFRVAENTAPGTYFGRITTSIRRDGKSYETTQGFWFYVLGEGEMVLKGKINGAEIEVRGPRESFPEGDMLSLKVTEVPDEKQDLVQQAMEQKAEDEGIAVNKMKAVDIKIIADGEEMEPLGDVTVRFSNVEMEEVTLSGELLGDVEDTTEEEIEETEAAPARFRMMRRAAADPVAAAEDAEASEGEVDTTEALAEESDESGMESTLTVWHLDEETGVLDDMDRVTVEDNGDVVMTTDHFSIYIVVDMNQLFGDIRLTVQHWGLNVNSIEGEAKAYGYKFDESKLPAGQTIDSLMDKNTGGVDTIYDWQGTHKVRQTTSNCEIYSPDTITLPNNIPRLKVEELSKVCLAAADKTVKNYTVNKVGVLVTKDTEGAVAFTDRDGKTTYWREYSVTGQEQNIKFSQDATIRIWYDPKPTSEGLKQPATFYDYNVTDGNLYNEQTCSNKYTLTGDDLAGNQYSGSTRKYFNARSQGINKLIRNATVGSNGSKSFSKKIYQFGQWTDGVTQVRKNNDENEIITRSFRKNGKTYENEFNLNRGTTLDPKTMRARIAEGIVGNSLENGNIVSGEGVYIYPDLFNNTPIPGAKNVLPNWKLSFNQVGDTYTLSKVYNDNDEEQLDKLETIWEVAAGTYGNNFWPLDKVDATDIKFGKQHSGNHSTLGSKDYAVVSKSDDGEAHNWFFGMRTDFDFTINDYTGPMKFYFRGDDDFWLFVDGHLAVDIGGIHLAVGESLDIRKFIKDHPEINQSPDYKHRLTIFYTERGGFGSCCYMQFILPSVEPVIIDWTPDKTSVSVQKMWEDNNNVTLRPQSIGVRLEYQKKDSNGNWPQTWETYSSKTLNSSNDWSEQWEGLPKLPQYRYRVVELGKFDPDSNTYVPVENYETTYSVKAGDGSSVQGNIVPGDASGSTVIITNTYKDDTVKVAVEKKWLDDDGKGRPESVMMIVEYCDTDGSWKPIAGKEDEKGIITLSESNGWKGSVGDLPKYRGKGQNKTPISYRVREVKLVNGEYIILEVNGDKLPSAEGSQWQYTVHYEDLDNLPADSDEDFKTIVTNSNTTSIQVNKNWVPATALDDDTVAKIGLYYKDGMEWKLLTHDYNKVKIQNPVILKKNKTSHQWLNLPKYLEEDQKVEYAVFEIGDDGKPIEENGIATIGGYKYMVTREVTEDVIEGNTSSTTVITNTLSAKIRVAKWINNWQEHSDLLADEFIVKLSSEQFHTGVVLEHAGENENLDPGKFSGYMEVIVEKNGTDFNVEEVVPKEYTMKEIRYVNQYEEADHQGATYGAVAANGIVHVNPGDDCLIIVHNEFKHSDYFHGENSVTNLFKGADGLPREMTEPPVVAMAAFLTEEKMDDRKMRLIEDNDRLM